MNQMTDYVDPCGHQKIDAFCGDHHCVHLKNIVSLRTNHKRSFYCNSWLVVNNCVMEKNCSTQRQELEAKKREDTR